MCVVRWWYMSTRRITGAILIGSIALDLVAAVAGGFPWVAPYAYGSIVLAVAIATLRDLRLGVGAVLLELILGSHGRLLVLPMGGGGLTLRMGIFLAVLGATLWHLRVRAVRVELLGILRTHPARWPAVAFAGSLAVAGVLGAVRHPGAQFVGDANAWAFLALTPAFLLALRARDRWWVTVLLAGALALIVRTYALLFLFSHDLGGLWIGIYALVRDTRLGEVTVFPGGFPRVFMASMVWLIPAALLAVREVRERTAFRTLALAVFGGGAAVLVLSLSRSFWLGMVALVGVGILALLHPHSRARMQLPTRTLAALVLAGGVALVLAVVVVRFPYPSPLTTAGLSGTLAGRFAQDAAVGNRWQQLSPLREAIANHAILGGGFGTTVTYTSKDPRTLAAFPDGKYTTFAFEWGYLDDLLERGTVGLIIQLWLLAALIASGMRGGEWPLALALLAIAIVHATSPYLNHPLGLGLLMLAAATTARERKTTPQ